MSLLLQPMNLFLFILRKHIRNNRLDANLFFDCLCRSCIVAGQHNDVHSHLLQSGNCLPAGGFYNVRSSNHAEELSSLCKIQRCLAFIRQFFLQSCRYGNVDPVGFHQFSVSRKASYLVDRSRDALSRDHLII